MQAKCVNSNTIDDMFIAFTMAQQIMIGLSGAMSEEETVAINTKAVFGLLKRNDGTSSQASKNQSIECQWPWEAGLQDQETIARTKNRCSPLLRDTSETSL